MTDEERTRIAVTFEQIAATCNAHGDVIGRLVANESACHTILSGQAEAISKDLTSFKEAIERLSANLAAEHRKMVEIANEVNKHAEILNATQKPKPIVH